MATETYSLSSLIFSSSFLMDYQSKLQNPMFSLLFFALSLVSLCFLFVSLYKRLKRAREEDEKSTQKALSILRCSFTETINKTHEINQTPLTHPLLVEILTSNSPKFVSLVSSFPSHLSIGVNGEVGDEQLSNGSDLVTDGVDSVGEDCEKSGDQRGKKKKKRSKKKKQNSGADDSGEDGFLENLVSVTQDQNDLICLYPFTSSSSATQRKIKQQYDQLKKSHESNGLTLAQVGQFANCLIEAKNELQHKSEIIQRKFTITKALLIKANRSSFDRLYQQISKLESEQKRLEEDASVYNRLQQQLKLSPAYKKMLEIRARMELKAKADQLVESTDTEFANISFEELLAQEKKDSFWQRNGKLRSCTS
ncbi:hypothetical protein HHK36_006014 [Tetracentron sinense]|uniref:Uncharacterized protein n=1 Tax=Tetracentron sinense TaxID=13715 RepID=A0A835DJU0_TETSI|nr:hypothetical protein HHK36_006014 [Tetracentron sinense]